MDTKNLDINMLNVFATLLDERSVTATARKLGLTQPTVSFTLNKLRHALGDDLFMRTPDGMQPTARAEQLRDPVVRILKTLELDILQSAVFVPSESTRTFVLSTSDVGELTFLPKLLDRLNHLAPQVGIKCVNMNPAKLADSMETGEVDLVLGYFPDLTGSSFYQQKLFDHPFICLVRQDHPTIGDTIDSDQFLSCEHVVVNQEGRSQEIAEKVMRRLGLRRKIVLHSPHFLSVPAIIARSDLIAIVPKAVGTMMGGLPGLKMLPPPFPIPKIEVKQTWHRRVNSDPANTWLRKIVTEIFQRQDPTLTD